MKVQDAFHSPEGRYSLGTVEETGQPFLSIPVTIGVADYEEYYALSDDEYRLLLADPREAAAFAEACRDRTQDERLIQKPGWNRGIPM
ncbi:hypothetical protein [Psychromicrobium xiongbiense]|uniref:hypothetical protein n=1 Tax=Psychromicrobium xiongbiense TaxID=3051184 RepID=UPI002555360E|nr:hypothetical protein [Psychromicrobium sp. YIM S02556]